MENEQLCYECGNGFLDTRHLHPMHPRANQCPGCQKAEEDRNVARVRRQQNRDSIAASNRRDDLKAFMASLEAK